ncbi:hypothetical protein CRM92_10665, partial [Rothia dentocariosa]
MQLDDMTSRHSFTQRRQRSRTRTVLIALTAALAAAVLVVTGLVAKGFASSDGRPQAASLAPSPQFTMPKNWKLTFSSN